MRTNWADHVVITVGGNTLEDIYQEWCAYKRDNVKLLNDKERMCKQLREQGGLIHKLKQEVDDKEAEIQKLLSVIDNLRDDLYEFTHKDQPQYYYGG